MNLSARILSEQLSKNILFSQFDGFVDELILNRPEHYVDQTELKKNNLYIAEASKLPCYIYAEAGSCLICVGKPDEKYLAQNFSIICVSGNIFFVFNQVQKIFDKYAMWDQTMQKCINSNLDLQNIVDKSEEIFENPLYLSDADYFVIAESKKNPLNIKAMFIPHNTMINLKKDKKYEEMWKCGAPVISQHEDSKYRHLSIIIKSHGRLAICISIMEYNITFRYSDAALLKHLSYYVSLYYEQNLLVNEDSKTSLHYLIKQKLNDNYVSEQDIERALGPFNWNIDQRYCVSYIELSKKDIRFNMVKYLCIQIEKIFNQACVFEYSNNIVLVINYSIITDLNKTEDSIRSFLQSSSLKLGISRQFTNLSYVKNYYLQAKEAVDIGKKTEAGLNYFKFEDYFLDYMIKNSCGTLLPESLCANGLMEMAEYDKIHNTQYIATLKTYFTEKFNATHAAKKLYIHRTTFLDRLEKIKYFLNMDLNDYRACLYLMLVLEIMNEQG